MDFTNGEDMISFGSGIDLRVSDGNDGAWIWDGNDKMALVLNTSADQLQLGRDNMLI